MFSILLNFLTSPSQESTTSPSHGPIYKGVPSMDKAATTIQKNFRGYLLRELYRRAGERRMAAQKEEAKARREDNRRKMKEARIDLMVGPKPIQRYIEDANCMMKKAEALNFLQTADSSSDDETFKFIQFLTEKYNNSHELSILFWKELGQFDISDCDSPPYAEVLKAVIPKYIP